MTSRRLFISLLPLAGALTLAQSRAEAQAPVAAPLDPKDPQAVALGYVPDATKADKVRFPKYAAPQACGSCALFQGKPGAATGPCPIYQGKLVSAKGWCSGYVKKA